MDREARVKSLYYVMQTIEGRLGGGEGVEGLYGSLSRTGMQRILTTMVHHCGMDKSSRLVDIGSGLGRPLLHALVDPGITAGYGVEIDRIKCEKAAAFLTQARGEMARRGHLALDTPLPAIKCAPVEKVRTLDPATHAYSFWEGVPQSARCAFARLFATSHSLRAVAVVQRAMRKADPAATMQELGFGKLALVQCFSVAMSGSGRSFTAYVFRRLDPPGQMPAPLSGRAGPLMQISPPWRATRSAAESATEAEAVPLPGTPEPQEHAASPASALESGSSDSAATPALMTPGGPDAASRAAELDHYWTAPESPSPPPRHILGESHNLQDGARAATRAERAWLRGQRAIAAAASKGLVTRSASAPSPSAAPPAPTTPTGRDENAVPANGAIMEDTSAPACSSQSAPRLAATKASGPKVAAGQAGKKSGAQTGAAGRPPSCSRSTAGGGGRLPGPVSGLGSPKAGRVAKKAVSPVKAAPTLSKYAVQRRGGAAKATQRALLIGKAGAEVLPEHPTQRPVRRGLADVPTVG